MNDDRIEAVQALLSETEAAHGEYESSQLGGVYDEAWPQWYASYAVEHGMADVLGRPVTAQSLAEQLTSGWAAYQALDPAPVEPWGMFIARRIAKPS
jgi:hypothetical protein